jgi:hypothetical protein
MDEEKSSDDEEDDGTDQEESDDENEENMQLIKDEEKDEKDAKGTIKVEIIENPFDNSEQTTEEKLEKANEKVYKWMAGIEPNKIEQTIGDWDKSSLLKLVEMANQEIQLHPQKYILFNYLYFYA